MVDQASRPASPAPQRWQSIGTVVVGSDGSPSATKAVHAAVDLAVRFNAALHVVTAYRSADERHDALTILSTVAADIRRHDIDPACHAREGDAAKALADVALERHADVIVVGSKGMTGAARLRGSVPNSVSHHAPCSVMIVHTVSG